MTYIDVNIVNPILNTATAFLLWLVLIVTTAPLTRRHLYPAVFPAQQLVTCNTFVTLLSENCQVASSVSTLNCNFLFIHKRNPYNSPGQCPVELLQIFLFHLSSSPSLDSWEHFSWPSSRAPVNFILLRAQCSSQCRELKFLYLDFDTFRIQELEKGTTMATSKDPTLCLVVVSMYNSLN